MKMKVNIVAMYKRLLAYAFAIKISWDVRLFFRAIT